jgi:hypothetical protein
MSGAYAELHGTGRTPAAVGPDTFDTIIVISSTQYQISAEADTDRRLQHGRFGRQAGGGELAQDRSPLAPAGLKSLARIIHDR